MSRLHPSAARRSLWAALLVSTAFASPVLAADLTSTASSGAASSGAASTGADTIAVETGNATATDGNIVVTARHRTEKLQEVPLAISAVLGQELNGQHLDRLGDFSAKIPNFSSFQLNPRVATVNIRGLGGNASNDGAEGGVGIIVDEVFFTHVAFAWLDLVDLESVEVARGPQGTLLGKNTTIGAVIVHTAKPSFTPSLNVDATVANNADYQLRANATGPLIDNKLAYRLTFAGDTGGGWVTNAYNGQKLLDNQRYSVRGQLLFTPSSTITDRLIFEHFRSSEYNNHSSVSSDITENLSPVNNSVYSARTASWTSKVAAVAPGYTPNFNGPYNANYATLGRTQQSVWGASNQLDADLGNYKLTSVTAWRKLKFRPHNDTGEIPYPTFDVGYNVDVSQYSQEVRIASPIGRRVDWTAGAYYLHEDLDSAWHTNFLADSAQYFLASAAASNSILNGLSYIKDGKVHVDSAAGFAQLNGHVTSRFTITGGLRFTRELKKLTVNDYTYGDSGLTGTALATQTAVITSLGGLLPVTTLSSNHSFVSWLVNPSFKLTDDVLLYASASGSAKSSAANTAVTQAYINNGKALIAPERSTDFEAGVKTQWFDKKLQVNLNLYRNTITNYQAAQIDPSATALGSILGNVGEVRLKGVELETTLRASRFVQIFGNVAYNDAKYVSYDNAPAPTEYAVYQTATTGKATLSLTGQQVIGVPRWTANATVDFHYPLLHGLELTGYVNQTYRSKVTLNNPLSQYGWQNGYGLTNLGLGVRAENGSWAIKAWSKNVFNKIYAVGWAAATPITPNETYWGNPRSFGVTFSKKF
ncbi:MAG TPA: TonB-dependent receptor [Novosphingobium sp.]|nr:TonB-dependent receptor [Novosphingobium sp.]HZV10889.1 TonB-dependent receptor [Novosphingobium sp.]